MRTLLVLAFLSLAAIGCGSSHEWRMAVKDTDTNWKALQHAAKIEGYEVTYVRERELLTRRFAQPTWNRLHGYRVAGKRRDGRIFFRVEDQQRVGTFGGAWAAGATSATTRSASARSTTA